MHLCLWIMPSYHLLYGNVCKWQQINLRCTLKGCQTFKKNKKNKKIKIKPTKIPWPGFELQILEVASSDIWSLYIIVDVITKTSFIYNHENQNQNQNQSLQQSWNQSKTGLVVTDPYSNWLFVCFFGKVSGVKFFVGWAISLTTKSSLTICYIPFDVQTQFKWNFRACFVSTIIQWLICNPKMECYNMHLVENF